MYGLATERSKKTNRRNFFSVEFLSESKCQWHSMLTESTSVVYKRYKYYDRPF